MSSSGLSPLPGFHRLEGREFAAGWTFGSDAVTEVCAHDPRAELERVLREALQTTPCVIGFSGGRDSSALLAVATNLARREGYEMPLPLTNRYPGIRDAEESTWQEIVINHLGIHDWIRQNIDNERDLLGPLAQKSLLEHGAMWPATVHNREFSTSLARGGCFVDGEGGDEVFGPVRMTPLVELLAARRPVDRDAARKIFYALAPNVLRTRTERTRVAPSWNRPWLKPSVFEWLVHEDAQEEARQPRRYRSALRTITSRRAVNIAIGNLDEMGRHHGLRYFHPFLDPGFVSALGTSGGRMGFADRTTAMRALFADLLPDAVLARTTKAFFNQAFIGRHSRDFIARWDGAGLDPDHIDVDALRSEWTNTRIHASTFHLLHRAWLAGAESSRS